MAQKSKSVYICSECGYETARWLGQCPNCNEWNTHCFHIYKTQLQIMLVRLQLALYLSNSATLKHLPF